MIIFDPDICVYLPYDLKKDGFARVLRGCLLKLSTGADGSQGLVNAHRVWPRSVWTLSLQAVLL